MLKKWKDKIKEEGFQEGYRYGFDKGRECGLKEGERKGYYKGVSDSETGGIHLNRQGVTLFNDVHELKENKDYRFISLSNKTS